MRTTVMLAALALIMGCGGDKGDSGDTSAPTSTAGTAGASGTAGATGTAGTATGGTERDGMTVYSEVCIACHGVDGRGSAAGPDLEPFAASYTDEQIADVALNGFGNMDPMSVTEGEALAVAAYIKTLF